MFFQFVWFLYFGWPHVVEMFLWIWAVCLHHIDNIMTVDGMVVWGAKSSSGMVLTWYDCSILLLPWNWLKQKYLWRVYKFVILILDLSSWFVSLNLASAISYVMTISYAWEALVVAYISVCFFLMLWHVSTDNFVHWYFVFPWFVRYVINTCTKEYWSYFCMHIESEKGTL